jgi:hypothetical protein
MNTKESLAETAQASSATSAVAATDGSHLSQNNRFYIHLSFQRSENPERASAPDVGENTYLIRFVHSDDLRTLAADARLSVTYGMPEMPEMGESAGEVTRKSDGSFEVRLFFSMPGRWSVNFKIEDGSVEDHYAFETKI